MSRRAMIDSPEGLTTSSGGDYSLANMNGLERVRQQAEAGHLARLADIDSIPDPYDERQKDVATARQSEQAYQESLPASIDDMNRFGLSGNYTRGQMKAIEQSRAAQDAARDVARIKAEGDYAAAQARAPQPHQPTPGQMNQMDARQHAQKLQKVIETMNATGRTREEIQSAIRGYINNEGAQFAGTLAKEFFSGNPELGM
jgi:hypothetical protein